MKGEAYYVLYRDDGSVGRLARITDGIAYGYNPEGKIWEFRPSLVRLMFEDTDYVEISKGEAERLISEM